MTHSALIERITRSLAYMLRHQPEEFDLELDADGYGELGEVVRALTERLGADVDMEDVERAIASGDRPRYEIVDDKVRALYGHSIDVEPGEASKPPQLLYVGINGRDAKRAVQYGLRGGRRRFLHLALTVEDARETGRRTGREYSVLTVHALDAWEEGVNFFDRTALYLAEQIPTEFLELTENRDDGIERHRDNGRDGARGGDRGRDRGRDRGGDRGRGRGRRGGRGQSDGRGREAREEHPSARRDDDREQRPSARDERTEERRPRREPRRHEPAAERPAAERPAAERPAAERPAPKPAAPAKPVKPAKKPASSGPSFGLGVFDEAEPAAPELPPEPAPEPEPTPEPELCESAPVEVPPEEPSSGGTGFGAGL